MVTSNLTMREARRHSLLIIICLLFSMPSLVNAQRRYDRPTLSHFKYWSAESKNFEPYLRSKCSKEYDFYLGVTDIPPLPTPIWPPWSENCKSCYIKPLLNCLLDHMTEWQKNSHAHGAVLLGLMPTVLGFAGPSAAELGLLALRRPILGFILAAASPAVRPIRALDYHGAARTHRWNELAREEPASLGTKAALISVLEYTVALSSVANVVHVLLLLCRWGIFYLPETDYLPALCAICALLVQIIGMAAVSLRVQNKPHDSPKTSIKRVIGEELFPCASQSPGMLILKAETRLFLGLSWLASGVTVYYLLYTSFVYSSALFINNQDALRLSARLFASILVSRIVLAYELRGLGGITDTQDYDLPKFRRRGVNGHDEVVPKSNATGI